MVRIAFSLLLVVCLAACNLNNSSPEATQPPSSTYTPTQPTPATLAPTQTPPMTALPRLTPTSLLNDAPTLAITAESLAPIGERETSLPRQATSTPPPVTATFPDTFPDRYTTATLNAGRTLLVNYSVTLNNPGVGQVFFVVLDPDGTEVDRWVITETEDGTREIPVEVSGSYEIRAAFRNLSGNYSLDFGFR